MASTIKVDNVQNQPGTNIVSKCGTDVTLGASGDTVALAAGASQTGFGRTGTVDWDTTIHTSTVTAVSGKGYFVDTTSGGITVNLPAASVGNIVSIKDYAGTFDTNTCTIAPNGSDNIGGGSTVDPTLTVEGAAVTLVYADVTQGWLAVQENVTTSPTGTEDFIIATGGTPCAGATCGDYKIHTFTGPGTFCVSQVATVAGNNAVAYMVVAGGAGGGISGSGGGGAGGFREGTTAPVVPYTASPIVAATGITVTASPYAITVGGGGAGSTVNNGSTDGTPGVNSTFSSITSAGGGGGGSYMGSGRPGLAGGSGGGGNGANCAPLGTGGAGDTPNVTPDQGFPGGDGAVLAGGPGTYGGGGGGGATVAGGNFPYTTGGAGGAGAGTGINPSPTYGTPGPSGPVRYFAGGGGGSYACGSPGGPAGDGGGGVGSGSPTPSAVAGTVNTGGGGGGGNPVGGGGGSGIVIIRYKFQ